MQRFLLIASFADSLLKFRGVLIEDLVKAGLEVHVASPNLTNDIKKELEAKGCVAHEYVLYRTGMNPIHDTRSLFSLYSLMKRIRPDYVLTYTIKPVIYGSLAACLSKVRNRFALITGLGYTFESEASGRQIIIQKLSRLLYKSALRRCKGVFFQNPDDQNLFREIGLLSKNTPTKVVNGSGIDLKHYYVKPLPEAPHFLMIARLLIAKGVREYADASLALKEKYPNATFSLVGWLDDNPDSIESGELDEWIDKGINFKGRMKDVREAIAEANVYVLPSYREGTPRTVLEAMAMGRPIISTDVPGCRETVNHGFNGSLIPAKSTKDLKKEMEKYLVGKVDLKEMGKASRNMAEEKFNVSSVNKIMLTSMGIANDQKTF